MSFKFLPPMLVPVAAYNDPFPIGEQPVFALPRKGTQAWAVPLKLNAEIKDWAITEQGDLVRIPLHSPSGGFNTREARDAAMLAAALVVGVELSARFDQKFSAPNWRPKEVAVQLILGDAVHEFPPGVITPESPAMFRFYLGIAFQISD